MIYRLLRRFLQVSFFVFMASTAAFGKINHDLIVVLYPDTHRIYVIDEITLPEKIDVWPIMFALHQNLDPKILSADATLKKTGAEKGLEFFEINLPPGITQFTIVYEGEIFHPVEDGEEYARGFSETSGIISLQGVYLSKSSYWYPQFYSYFTDELTTFSIGIELPFGWFAVSQGSRAKHFIGADFTYVRWTIDDPQEEIYIVANQFTEYNQTENNVDAMVFLREPNEKLAQKYLEVTHKYIKMYSELLGLYPYEKFALVENFWETGYGMPSFTLLGSSVINFPFILHTSYPHEILHNWWGNSVFVDNSQGNWCEGLTAYLADHYLKEQRGEGAEYRRLALQKYKNYVKAGVGRDFPIAEFRERHNESSEAIGYGKTAMFFHMMRRQVGNEVFFKALRRFYQEYKFKAASFDDIERIFSEVSGQNLRWMFEQWIEKTGAPSLKLQDVIVKKESDGFFTLSAVIEQTQDKFPYWVKIPIVVHMEGITDPYRTSFDISGREIQLNIILPGRPIRLDVDPEFDVFRVLDRNETPPAISQIFGSEKILAILPANAPETIISGYRGLAKSWQISEVKFDNELRELPSDRAIWILGWENKFRSDIDKALFGYDFTDNQDIYINGVKLSRNQHSIAIMARNPLNNDYALGWLATNNVSAIPGLGRKLPHYNSYGYLGFTGDEPTNALKGQWPIVNSPLSILLPLENAESRMKNCVECLVSENLEGRGLGAKGIDKAAEFIAKQFTEIGLAPVDDKGSYFQTFQHIDEKSGKNYTVKNIIGIIRGKNDKENIVIGAHYDHLGRGELIVKEEKYKGQIHPGANDNASGVAVLLEVARSLVKQDFQPDCNIIFVAFSGEEVGRIGSKYYVSHLSDVGEKCVGMINLDTVGRVEDNKLLIIGAQSAKEWEEILKKAAFAHDIELIFVKEDLDSSDQKSFHEAGIPAVQLFSGAGLDYHQPSDTADKINFRGLAKVAKITEAIVKELSSRDLTVTLKPEEISSKPKEKIKVGLGTIPDFTYQGVGYKLAGVKPDSPAEKVGLRAGDIIVGIDSKDVKDLRGFSDILRSLKAGDKVFIVFLRNEEKRETEIILK